MKERINQKQDEIKSTIAILQSHSGFLDKYLEAVAIVESDKTWEEKHDLIFAPDIFGVVYDLVTYMDMDEDYENDVKRFMRGFKWACDFLVADLDLSAILPAKPDV